VPRERYDVFCHVMPVWHDVHRTCGAAFLADKAPTDCRPGQVLGQGVQPNIDHTTIALAARTLDVAGHVTVGDPFRRAAKWEFLQADRLSPPHFARRRSRFSALQRVYELRRGIYSFEGQFASSPNLTAQGCEGADLRQLTTERRCSSLPVRPVMLGFYCTASPRR